ncbi:hypothetical protein Leryth_021394 [Lithospermum erythrorhizon]|nr:hypothetical protein Leryth_021394 [Lithospermum erythrorhizon]
MGFSKKFQAEGGRESEPKKWVISGIPIRSQMKSNSSKPKEQVHDDSEEDQRSTTPTRTSSRIPENLPCPPAPRKPRTTSNNSSCNFNGAIEFFNPPELESVFIRRQFAQS